MNHLYSYNTLLICDPPSHLPSPPPPTSPGEETLASQSFQREGSERKKRWLHFFTICRMGVRDSDLKHYRLLAPAVTITWRMAETFRVTIDTCNLHLKLLD